MVTSATPSFLIHRYNTNSVVSSVIIINITLLIDSHVEVTISHLNYDSQSAVMFSAVYNHAALQSQMEIIRLVHGPQLHVSSSTC